VLHNLFPEKHLDGVFGLREKHIPVCPSSTGRISAAGRGMKKEVGK